MEHKFVLEVILRHEEPTEKKEEERKIQHPFNFPQHFKGKALQIDPVLLNKVLSQLIPILTGKVVVGKNEKGSPEDGKKKA